MATGDTVFLTYQIEGEAYGASSLGHSTSIHSNYIVQIDTSDISNRRINLQFSSVADFPFLVVPSASTTGYGWSGFNFNVLAQIITGSTGDTTVATPDPTAWKTLDLTAQINNHTVGTAISAANLTSTLFEFTPDEYYSATTYTLSYLTNPTSGATDADKLSFGEEVFFYGNVATDIKATAYTTDIPIVLPLNEFNSTTNPTWDGLSEVQISEIGIYDDNNNLVAIGKLNHPISKSSEISRTIVFAMDF